MSQSTEEKIKIRKKNKQHNINNRSKGNQVVYKFLKNYKLLTNGKKHSEKDMLDAVFQAVCL